MGTITILRLLLRNWSVRSPIYKNEERHVATFSTRQLIRHVILRIWKPVGILLAVLIYFAIARLLFGNQGQALSPILICTTGGFIFVLGGLLLVSYLWPAFIAVSASRVISVEREHRTWDILLTTPYEWRDLVMAKLAASLHGFNAYSGAFLYMQVFLVAVIVALVLGQSPAWTGAPWSVLNLVMIVAAAAEFVIARAQDYVLASMVGLLASLLTPTRQGAATVALMTSLAVILIRMVVTGVFLAMLPAMTSTTLLLMLAVGPSTAVVFAASLPIAIIILLAMVLIREGAIRLMFQWLLTHLADGEQSDAPQAA